MTQNSLGRSCQITTGKLDSNAAVSDGKYPFFTCSEFPERIDTFAFDSDVVLVAGNNANGNFHVSRFKGKFNAYQRTYVISALEGISIDYVYYALKLELKRLREKSQGSQTKFLTKGILEDIVLKDLSYRDQRVISSVLSQIDEKIQLNNKINSELEAMIKLIYDYWFVQFDFPDENGKPYKSSGGKMVYDQVLKRDIPSYFGVSVLGDELDTYDSSRVPLSKKERKLRKGPYPYYGATGEVDHIDDYLFDGEYILLAEDGSVMNPNGQVIVQFVTGQIWVNNHAHVLRAKNENDNEFFYQTLKLVPAISVMSGSVQKKITHKNLIEHKMIRPDPKLKADYSKIVKSMRDKCFAIKKENKFLSDFRDWLLPMLMNSQITVNEAAE